MTTVVDEYSTRASSRPEDQLDPKIMDVLKLHTAKNLPFLHQLIDIRPDIVCESCSSNEDDLNLLISFSKIAPERYFQRWVVAEGTYLPTQAIIRPEYGMAKAMAFPAIDDDLLDWDARIEIPPERPSSTIRVKLEYRGRSRPIPVDDL